MGLQWGFVRVGKVRVGFVRVGMVRVGVARVGVIRVEGGGRPRGLSESAVTFPSQPWRDASSWGGVTGLQPPPPMAAAPVMW